MVLSYMSLKISVEHLFFSYACWPLHFFYHKITTIATKPTMRVKINLSRDVLEFYKESFKDH